jgi:branched-chain amino acid transport system permease protein
LGQYIFLMQVVVLIWGNDPQSLVPGAETIKTRFLGRVPLGQAIIAAACIAGLGAFYAWLLLSNVGLRLRALASNPTEMQLAGQSDTRLRTVAFGLSGALCALSSLAAARNVGFDPHAGMVATLSAIVATFIGGRYSYWGPFLGGLLVGAIRAATAWSFGTRWQDVAVFLFLGCCLLLFPNGLLAHRQRVEYQS